MKKEMLNDVSKTLFSASEYVRDALDTIDIEKLPVRGEFQVMLNSCHDTLEMIAQYLQKDAKK